MSETSVEAWVDPVVFTWDAYLGTTAPQDLDRVRRAYAHWAHAEQVLAQESTEFHRVDVITTLKRAVDHRLRLLNDCYRWKKLKLADRPEGWLQVLETFGIARHTLVSRLITLRNRVEHSDADPPTAAECETFVEFVWYFLRVTDVLASRIPEIIEFDSYNHTDSDHTVEVSTGPASEWRVKVQGDLADRYLSREAREGWAQVRLERCTTRGEWLKAEERVDSVVEMHQDLDPSDLFFSGEVVGPDEVLLLVYRALLTAL